MWRQMLECRLQLQGDGQASSVCEQNCSADHQHLLKRLTCRKGGDHKQERGHHGGARLQAHLQCGKQRGGRGPGGMFSGLVWGCGAARCHLTRHKPECRAAVQRSRTAQSKQCSAPWGRRVQQR